ncbi:hypothetical protein [Nodosilinea nodulosa]|uniref:hypothetical protein n=1 Tax=Nodosilinea nodulosa TaxID=416001 RepID=UPI0002F78BB7|nr:hypothetical protein [Nodosilinea nodulosa]
MHSRPVKAAEEFEAALREIDQLFDSVSEPAELAQFELTLADLPTPGEDTEGEAPPPQSGSDQDEPIQDAL